jgi:hypothetical protein
MKAARSMALAAFAIRTNLRSTIARGGLLAFVAIAGLGPILSARNGQGWALDADLLFYGYLTGALFVLRSGLEQQRETGLTTFLRHNFATPVEHAAGAALSILGVWLFLTGVLWLVALACSGFDFGAAVWYAWVFGLALSLMLPFVIAVESVSSFRIPLILPVIVYLALMVVLALTIGEARMAALLGISADRADPASSLRLAARAGLIVPLGMATFMAATWVRNRGSHVTTGVPMRH